jgi:serine acetyltransferase
MNASEPETTLAVRLRQGTNNIAMSRISYPKNPYIKNGRVVDWYLSCLRRKWRIPGKLIGLLLGCEIGCQVPERIFMPHPNGIVVDTHTVLSNDVVLLQQVTLGVAHPYYDRNVDERLVDPILKEGVYVGPGAKVLGHITIGEWSVIGANAVITRDVPPNSIAVGNNRILDKKAAEIKWLPDVAA